MGASPTYPLIIAQFALDAHPRRSEHWIIGAFVSKDQAQIFELTGNIDTYAFTSSTVSLHAFEGKGGYMLCRIPADKLGWLQDMLSTLRVVRSTTDHDCQTWVMAAVRRLQDKGYVGQKVTANEIREEMAKEKERWEVADDTLVERLMVDADDVREGWRTGISIVSPNNSKP